MKTAKVAAIIINIVCPHCDASICSDSGSYDFTSDSILNDTITCDSCNKKSRVPSVAGLFVARS